MSVLAAILLGACTGDLSPPSFVDRTRIVAARVAPDRDAAVAEPSRGDAITIEWLTVTPGEPEEIAATLVACAPAAGSGSPACDGSSIVPLAPRPPSLDPFVTALSIPEDAGPALLIFGAVCAGGGTPSLPMGSAPPTCEGSDRRADLVALEIPIAAEAATANRHPTLADEPWTLDGAAWDPLPADLALGACASIAGDPSFPIVSRSIGRDVPITIGWSEDDREAFDGGREALQINHFTTLGRMARSTSAADDLLAPGTPVSVDWEVPIAEQVPAEGIVIRMTAIARDGRGGVDRADRALCATP